MFDTVSFAITFATDILPRICYTNFTNILIHLHFQYFATVFLPIYLSALDELIMIFVSKGETHMTSIHMRKPEALKIISVFRSTNLKIGIPFPFLSLTIGLSKLKFKKKHNL